MPKTFEFDNQLPSLPLPTLEHTLERYLDSVRAVTNDEEYTRTKKLVEEFARGIGRELHEQLKADIDKRQERNWIARWWDEEIYFKWRLPIAPLMNMMGFNCLIPPKIDSQIERAAIHMHCSALVYESLREERYPVAYMAKQPLMMHQFRHFFNTCRIPRRGCDELSCCFRTVSEDAQSPPTHTVVFCNGHIFTFDLYDSKRLLTLPELEQRLKKILEQSKEPGQGIGALTALPRDDWADIRDYMCQMGEQNRNNFKVIETALTVYALEQQTVDEFSELARIGMLKNPKSRWYDRSNIFIMTQNGLVVTNSDHSPFEGIIPLQVGDQIEYYSQIVEKIDSWPSPSSQNPVRELIFLSDTRVTNAIEQGVQIFSQTANDIEVLYITVNQCTKEDIKQYVRIHPDSFFQLCLQLAYFKLHNYQPAPTYETAPTRRFYRGRTETARTCTPEAIAWCRAMINPSTDGERRRLFLLAANRHLEVMAEAIDNQGCDRHLFGLSMIANENGKSFPLTDDPSWVKSGGGGNFILSTSGLGFGAVVGGTSPMCLNGYGVFYRISSDATTFVVTAYRSCPTNNARALANSIERTLIEVKTLFLASNL